MPDNIPNYRVIDKHNVHQAGHKTSFSIYEYSYHHHGYLYVGNYFAHGFNASDESCIKRYQWEKDSA